MNIEFHYYMVYYLAKEAGFQPEEAYTIAYASQYTDDNRTCYKVKKDENEFYKNYMSQTMDISNPRNELMRVYLSFHFLPGDFSTSSAYRRDGKLHFLNTTPNSKNAKKVMENSLKGNNLYKLGIALHVFADTWSHQNYVGFRDYLNADYKKILQKIIPNIGHADFITQPDEVSLIWNDDRLIPSHAKIRNKERMLEALKESFFWLMKYRDNKVTISDVDEKWENISKQLSDIMGDEFEGKSNKDNKENRIEAYKKLIGTNFKEYNKERWFQEAVECKKKIRWFPFPKREIDYTFKDDFVNSNWYQFQESIKEHQGFIREILDEKFKKMEIHNF